MSIIEAIILGIIQGLTEFLPISSSGHLTIVPFMFGWDEPTLAFVVAAHLGTVSAVIYIFRAEVQLLVRTVLRWREAAEPERSVVRFVAIGSIPAAVVGVGFEGLIGDAFDKPVLVALLLGVTGYILMSTETAVEFSESDARSQAEMNTGDAVTIGVAQALAILPGISRSGATIAAGMRRGLSRTTAARFSFLLSVPVILGAGLYQLPDMFSGANGGASSFLIAFVASAISGFYAIRWFLGLIQRRGLRPFGVYCVFAMIAGLLTALARG